MNDGISGAVFLAGVKLYGLKAFLGMIGTSLLYLALPPVDKNGKLNRREFFFRLACAGVCSALFGDLALNYLMDTFPKLHFADHRAAIYLLVGAPAWIFTRAIALYGNKNKDIVEIKNDIIP